MVSASKKKNQKPHLSVESTDSQLASWAAAAHNDGGRSLSSWVRAVLDKAASKQRSTS